MTDKQALRTDLLIVNALETAKQLRELQESPVAEAIFESIVENENGKEIQFERPISDLAYAAFLKIERLVEALESAKQDSAKWFKAFEKAVSVGARYEERIEELTGKLEAAEQRSAELVHNHRVHAARLIDERGQLKQRIAELEARSTLQVDYFASLISMARLSADKAMRKFPQPNYVLLKVAEEAGEVVQAGVHYAENRMTWNEVEGEIVQLLAMLIRLVTEGDQINGVTPPQSARAAGIGKGDV